MFDFKKRLTRISLKLRSKGIAIQIFFKNWFFHPVVERVVGEKLIELGNLLFIGLVVTEIFQVQARAVFVLAGIVSAALCYTFGSLTLKQLKESI